MRSPTLALSRQIWSRHRLGMAIVFAILAAGAVLFEVLPPESLGPAQAAFLSFQFFFALIYVAAVFSYGFDAALERPESGFPKRQFTLPVRTAALVGWPMLQGMAVVALLWAGWAHFVMRPSGIAVAIGSTALQAAALVAVLQTLLWWPFGLAWVRVVFAIIFLTLLALLPKIADSFEIGGAWVPVSFAALIPVSYLAAVAGVARARRGDTPRWWSARATVAPRQLRARAPFASPSAALLWFERRRHLRMFVLAIGGILGLYLPMTFLVAEVPENYVTLVVNFLMLPILLAPILGSTTGRPGTSTANASALSPFLAARPVSSAAIVAAKLKLAALGCLVAWAMVLLAMCIWLLQSDAPRHFAGWWERGPVAAGRQWEVAAGIVALALWLLLMSWRLAVNNFCFSLAGRAWIYYGTFAIYGVCLVGGAMVMAGLVSHPERHPAILEALPWWAGAAVALKLALAVCVVRALIVRRLAEPRTLAKLLGVWLLVALVLFALARFAIPMEKVSTPLLAFAVVLSLPLARVAAAPLSVEWNRHR
jgi:hypothetical protein